MLADKEYIDIGANCEIIIVLENILEDLDVKKVLKSLETSKQKTKNKKVDYSLYYKKNICYNLLPMLYDLDSF